MYDLDDEKYLVNAIRQGNKEAFVQLIRKYERLVLHIVTPLVGVNEDREDICQDVFLKVYENLDGFQFRSKMGTWIGNIAYNMSINFLKRRKKFQLSDFMVSETGESTFERLEDQDSDYQEIFVRREEASQLRALIDGLPEIQRSIVLLFYQDDQSLDEIGSMLEMPVNTVKSHLFRARNSLKKNLINRPL
jgi:RNA polymerase sigma-70 factor (ECF subfamily)